jgi:hypothetical protein
VQFDEQAVHRSVSLIHQFKERIEKTKDRHVGLGIFANYAPSTGCLKDSFFKTGQGVAVEAHEPSSSRFVDHRLAILVHQGSDPTPPYQALVIRESAMLFSRLYAMGHQRRSRLACLLQLREVGFP